MVENPDLYIMSFEIKLWTKFIKLWIRKTEHGPNKVTNLIIYMKQISL